jgi:coenzyme F420-reducing hydrogenase delta subunit
MAVLSKLLEQIGVNPKRFRLEWVSATEAAKFAQITTEMVEEIKRLEPYGGNQ